MDKSFEETKKVIFRRTGMIECIFRLHKDAKEINAMTVTRLYNKLSGETIDWHVASKFLDERTRGDNPLVQTKGVNSGGLQMYRINI